jgi:hypothetical protein
MSVSKALYINCLQRTQTQQLFKDYLMIGLKSSYKNPKKSLKEGIPKYEERLDKLNAFFLPLLADQPKVQAELKKARTIWDESKELLLASPTHKNAKILEKNFHEMVHLLGRAKVLAKKSFKAVGMTGGLCRDPLYMANTYLMKIWGVPQADYTQEMDKRIQHFNSNIAKLKAYKGNNAETKGYIHKSEKAFTIFTMMHDSKNTSVPTLIAKKADTIFLYIRTLKKLYGEMLH